MVLEDNTDMDADSVSWSVKMHHTIAVAITTFGAINVLFN